MARARQKRAASTNSHAINTYATMPRNAHGFIHLYKTGGRGMKPQNESPDRSFALSRVRDCDVYSWLSGFRVQPCLNGRGGERNEFERRASQSDRGLPVG